jgi:hypothetical protein
LRFRDKSEIALKVGKKSCMSHYSKNTVKEINTGGQLNDQIFEKQDNEFLP